MAYVAEIIKSNRELSKKERVMYKDASDCKRLDEETSANGRIRIKPELWLELSVHNDKAKDNKDYNQYVIVDKNGDEINLNSIYAISTNGVEKKKKAL